MSDRLAKIGAVVFVSGSWIWCSDERLRAAAGEQVQLVPAEVTCAATLVDDLGADSLDEIEIVMAVEEAFGLDELLPDDTTRIRTVGELADLVLNLLKRQARVVAA